MIGRSTSEAVDSTETLTGDTMPDGRPSPSVVAGVPLIHLKRRLMFADAVAIAVAIILAFQLQMFLKPVPDFVAYEHLALSLVALPFFALGAGFNHLYLARANARVQQEVWNVVKAVAVSVVALVTTSFVVQYDDLSRLWVSLFAFSMTAMLVIERLIARRIFAKLRSTGQLSRRIVIVGTDPDAIGLMHVRTSPRPRVQGRGVRG